MSFYILIDSRYKSYGSNSNFSVQFGDFGIDSGVDCYVSLDSCCFYNTQYTVNSYNNSITFNEGAGNLTLTLTEGNYDGDSFATELETQLIAVGANTYSLAYSASTNKITITMGIGETLSFVSIDSMFGFEEGNTNTSSYVSENVVILSGFEYVDLCLPSLFSNNSTNNPNTNGIVKRVNLDQSFGSLIAFETGESDDAVAVSSEYLNNIRCMLLNPDGTEFLLNDNTYLSLVLKCKIVF